MSRIKNSREAPLIDLIGTAPRTLPGSRLAALKVKWANMNVIPRNQMAVLVLSKEEAEGDKRKRNATDRIIAEINEHE